MASPNQPVQAQTEQGQRVEETYVTPPPQPPAEVPEWEQAPTSGWLTRTWAERFGAIQLVALAVTLLGMLLTLIAAIKADNPTSPIAITLVGVAILMLTVRRRPEAAS